ncbi:putative nuclease HARBI1 [Dermacentor andersoni]|uniref:putative nuclease HARBI1 n=1 Tax=Dermacentor andersoni TaxID=34620 RepID=UPI003B3B725D
MRPESRLLRAGLSKTYSVFSNMAALRLARLEMLSEHLLRRERVFRDRTNPMDAFSEEELQRRVRFGRDGIVFLVEFLRSEIEHPTCRSGALSSELQVMLALKFFASGCFLITAGDVIGAHESTASRTVRRVASSGKPLSNHLFSTACFSRQLYRRRDHPRFLSSWPSPRQVRGVQGCFYAVAGFPRVVGAIDGTHVRIQAPGEHEEAYVNRHFYHSINVELTK